MDEKSIKELVDQYLHISFSIERCGGSLIKGQLAEDLTNDQHYMLRYMNKVEVCTSTELAEVFDVKKSAITAIINRLWKKGLIQRSRDENDRRVVYLTLTNVGKELFDETERRIYELVGSFVKQFEQTEIEAFMRTYEKLNQMIIASKEAKVGE
ncbi:MarR family winged helix-turn-helix transcriptional regulator [Neobacillus jeddahensis]|uniref:MarR family winged helix-turn-helix transcriptional regulator n=1 Tax=Neobacillus jeddahensis TaxID=1461580 RepID=UPI0005909669|nr:MarR family transcriptional regulator [Neobacillus jeddahensis]